MSELSRSLRGCYVHETKQQARKRVQTWVSAAQATNSSTQTGPLPVPGHGWRLRRNRSTPWRLHVGEDDNVAVPQAETVHNGTWHLIRGAVKAPEAGKGRPNEGDDLNSPLDQFLCKYCHTHCMSTVLSPDQERLECPTTNQAHGSKQEASEGVATYAILVLVNISNEELRKHLTIGRVF